MFILCNCLMSKVALKSPIACRLMVKCKQMQRVEGQRMGNWPLWNERADVRSRAFQGGCEKYM